MTAPTARPATTGLVKNWFDFSKIRGDLLGGQTRHSGMIHALVVPGVVVSLAPLAGGLVKAGSSSIGPIPNAPINDCARIKRRGAAFYRVIANCLRRPACVMLGLGPGQR